MHIIFVFQMLGCLVVEAVFPVCGLTHMWDSKVNHNEDILRKLAEGAALQEADGGGKWWLWAGSQPEGLAMERRWGHGRADEDIMWLYGGDLAVYVPDGEQTPEAATLLYSPEGCPPAYSRLKVLNSDKLLAEIVRCSRKIRSVDESGAQQCKVCHSDKVWLHSRHLLEGLQSVFTMSISGPEGQRGGLIESASTLVCSASHPAIKAYIERPRKHWPSPEQTESLLKQPTLLVMVGPKGTLQDSILQFRVSWSHLEIILITTLPTWVKQAYVCFKYTLKSILASLRPLHEEPNDDGRSQVGSYHLKTVFLRYLEEHPPKKEGSPFHLVLDLCQDLRQYLEVGFLPHYFLPDCDLFKTVETGERQYAIQAVERFIDDPVAAIIHSPSEPRVIYGNYSAGDLIQCFRTMSSQSSSLESHENLQQLFCDLDKRREVRHHEQLDWNEGLLSERPGLVKLAACLKCDR